MSTGKYKIRDFFDVQLRNKIASVHRYIHRVAYDDQEPVKTPLFADVDNILAQALHDHYCITLIECPFRFNFESLLNQFGWFCQFMYFNFSETKIQLDILKKLRGKDLSIEEINMLLEILTNDKEPYQFSLNKYQGKAKFALMKRQNMGEKGTVAPFIERDHYFRLAFAETLESIRAEKQEQEFTADMIVDEDLPDLPVAELPMHDQPDFSGPKKYEPSLYGYLRLNDYLSMEQKGIVINFLYDILHDLFYQDISSKNFEAIFYQEQSTAVSLNVSKPSPHHLDAQKMHWLLRCLKDKIISASWDVVASKIVVHNKKGQIIKSVYQFSEDKIASNKKKQIENLLAPLFKQLPDYLPH
jgi:hypothetical protein